MAKTEAPIHPGEILLKEFIEPLGLSQSRLAVAIRVEPRRVNEIVNGKRAVTTDTALRLGRFFGTGPEVWLNLQQEFDLRIARKQLTRELQRIEPIDAVVA